MSRGLSSANLTEIAAARMRPAFFAEFDFAGGVVRFWSGKGSFDLDGDTYTGLGMLGPVGGLRETTQLEATSLSFSLSGIPSALTSAVLSEVNRGRSVKLWLGFLNEARTALVDDPILRFAGRMDRLRITEDGGASTITIPAESMLALLTRPRPYRLSHEEQQRRFTGDLGLQYLAQTGTKIIYFGTEEPPAP